MIDKSGEIPRMSISFSYAHGATRVIRSTYAIRFESLVEAPRNPANAATC